jgi:hypothetical protein
VLLIWLVLLLAVSVHEGSHFLVLRHLAARPRPTIGILGPGWVFQSGHLSDRQLRLVWAAGPVTETLVWGSAAICARGLAGPLLTLLVVQLLANSLLPGSDGWKLIGPRVDGHHRVPTRRRGPQRPWTYSHPLRVHAV